MTGFYVPLEKDEKVALLQLAKSEKRKARHQAALLIRRELERLGMLEPDRPAPASGQAA